MPTRKKQNSTIAVIEKIEDKIYIFRGQRVMLDSDLAKIYKVETRVLNQAVNRNLTRFPLDFVFQLTREECRFFDITNCDIKDRSWMVDENCLTPLQEHGAIMLATRSEQSNRG